MRADGCFPHAVRVQVGPPAWAARSRLPRPRRAESARRRRADGTTSGPFAGHAARPLPLCEGGLFPNTRPVSSSGQRNRGVDLAGLALGRCFQVFTGTVQSVPRRRDLTSYPGVLAPIAATRRLGHGSAGSPESRVRVGLRRPGDPEAGRRGPARRRGRFRGGPRRIRAGPGPLQAPRRPRADLPLAPGPPVDWALARRPPASGADALRGDSRTESHSAGRDPVTEHGLGYR